MKTKKELTNQWINYFWSITGAVSVRIKILGIALILVFLLGGVAILVVRASMQSVVTHELELRAASIAEDLANRATDAILVNNQFLLNQLISETKTSYPDIRYIFVVDSTGRVLAHTFGTGFPIELIAANSVPPGGPSRVSVLNTTEGLIWDSASPIFEGRVGTIRLGLSDAFLGRTVNTVTVQLLLATLFVSTVGILLAIFLTRVLTHPIQQLAQAAHAVGQGDLDQRVSRWADDEIGELADSFNDMVKNLRLAEEAQQERQRLRNELVERVMSAQEDERKRIARDLHDQTSQSLVSLIVQLKLVETASDETTRKKSIVELREQLRTALGEVRKMALDLRPNALDDLGLVQAVHWFADRCHQNSGLQVTVRTTCNLECLSSRYSLAFYRVIQEALSNAAKHSQATRVWVDISSEKDRLWLEIRDDGKGFDVSKAASKGGGLGIFGMRERIELLGGQFSIESAPGSGSRIYAWLPLLEIPPQVESHQEMEKTP
jgi:signal transduction histidine kinase